MEPPEPLGLGVDLTRAGLDQRPPEGLGTPELFRDDVVLRAPSFRIWQSSGVDRSSVVRRPATTRSAGEPVRFRRAIHARTIARAEAARRPPAGLHRPAAPIYIGAMRTPRDFFKPLALGAPAPMLEIPVKPSR